MLYPEYRIETERERASRRQRFYRKSGGVPGEGEVQKDGEHDPRSGPELLHAGYPGLRPTLTALPSRGPGWHGGLHLPSGPNQERPRG